MADQRQGGIEWCDVTWNVVVGCSRVSAGCAHCYAERQVARLAGPGGINRGLVKKTDDGPRFTGEVRFFQDRLLQPLSWRAPKRVFVNALSDLFHENLGLVTIARVFAVMALARRHTFQVLTKRAMRMRAILNSEDFEREVGLAYGSLAALKDIGEEPLEFPLRNVWLGVSVEDQQRADERIPDLLATPSAVRWLSVEPLLGPVSLARWLRPTLGAPRRLLLGSDGSTDVEREVLRPGVDWVVVGGESGPGAREMKPEWARAIRDECVAERVPFLFKQWGEWARTDQVPDETFRQAEAQEEWDGNLEVARRFGKRAAGRLLDERTWDQYPRCGG